MEKAEAYIRRAVRPGVRVTVLCIGSVLCGDDAAGMLLAPMIEPAAREAGSLVLACSTAPENFSGVVRGYRPDVLILVDAAHMGLAPGDVQLIPPDEITGASFSTHMLPLKFLLGYLAAETGCETAVIGIEPRSCEPADDLSDGVRRAVDSLAETFCAAFRSAAAG